MVKNTKVYYLLAFANWILVTAIFVGDLVFPLGVAGGVLYVSVVLIALLLSRRQVFLFAACSTGLIVVGLLVSPHGSLLTDLANRFLGALAIWVAAILGLRLRQRTSDVIRQARILGEVCDGIIVMDSVGRIDFCNRAARDIFGYSDGELVGRSASPLFAVEPGVDLETVLQGRPPSQGPFRLNLNGRHRNGEQFPARVWVLHRLDDEGKLAGFILGFTDETNHLPSDEKVHELEDFYHDLLDKLPLQVALFDAEGRFAYLNPASLSSPEMRRWILGKTEREYFDKVGRNTYLVGTRETYFRRSIYQKAPVVFEEEFLCMSGEMRFFLHGFSPVVEPDGQIFNVVGYRYDVTNLKTAERNLAESHARLHAIVDTAGDGIVTIDSDGLIESANQVAVRLLGYSQEEITGLHVNCLLSPLVEGIASWHLGARTRFDWLTGSEEIREVCARHKDETTFPAELIVSGLPLPDRHLYTIILRDITDRKRAERALRRYNERLKGLRRIDQSILTARSPREVAEVVVRHLLQMIPATRVCVVVFKYVEEVAHELAILDDGSLKERTQSIDAFDNELARFEAGTNSTHPGRFQNGSAKLAAPQIPSYEELRIDIPLRVQHLLIGILSLESDTEDGFEESDLDIAQEVAGPLAIALHDAQLFEEVKSSRERLRALSRRLVEVQEEERRRLARELHDEVGQTLTGLKLLLETADLHFEIPPADTLDEAKEVVRQLLGRVRNLSLDLRPAMLDDLGLVPALLWLVDRYERQTRIQVDFRHELDDGLTPDVETAAYRIVQEALTNVARHSEARKATVLVRSSEDQCVVTVKDGGVGFDLPTTAKNGCGTGLSGIQERVDLLGGVFTVETGPHRGTCLTAVLPRNGDAA